MADARNYERHLPRAAGRLPLVHAAEGLSADGDGLRLVPALGRKRQAMVDTDGRALVIQVHPANVQDRDGAIPLLQESRRSFPFVELAFADSAYNADRVRDATSIAIEVVKKLADQVGFVVLPRRWVVERFFAWINRNRRLAKDFEGTIASAETFLYAASAMLLTRRLARYT